MISRPKPKVFAPRKLLVAAAGVATINYVAAACGGQTTSDDRHPTSGNLPNPVQFDQYSPPPTSGNLPMPPPPDDDAGDASDAGDSDANDANDASDASDAR